MFGFNFNGYGLIMFLSICVIEVIFDVGVLGEEVCCGMFRLGGVIYMNGLMLVIES